jgi:hypothetical protein
MIDNNTVGSGVGPGAALSPVEDGDYFQQLLSLDSNEHAFLQPTKAKQPLVTFVDTDFNGRPSMTLSTDDLLRAAKTISTALTGTFFLAFKRGDSGADHAIFTSSDEGSATRRLEFGVDANNDHEYQQDNNDVDDVLSSGVTVGTTSPQINTWRSSGSAISLRVNAVAASLVVDGGANGGDWFGDVANRDNAVIGALLTSAGESKQLNGKIAALILYDAYLTDKECFQVEKYLQRKFAIPGA